MRPEPFTRPIRREEWKVWSPDRRVVEVATRQFGRVRRGQLRDAGLTDSAIRDRVARGFLRREHQGVYVVGHLARVAWGGEAGALLAVPAGVLSHRSAARLHGLLDHVAGPVDVTVPSARRAQRAGVVVHRSDLVEHEVTTVHGLRVTTVQRTVQDLAASPDLERLIAAAHGRGHGLAVQPNRRGAERLRAALEGPRITRSEAERALIRLVRKAGLPLPETNVRIGGWEVDALWRPQRVAVEVDSWAWHGQRGSFERDRRKDRALRGAGLTPVRLTATQITTEPEATAADLAATLARAA